MEDEQNSEIEALQATIIALEQKISDIQTSIVLATQVNMDINDWAEQLPLKQCLWIIYRKIVRKLPGRS